MQVLVPDCVFDAKTPSVGYHLPAVGLLTRRPRRTPSRGTRPNGPLSAAVVLSATHSCATVRDSHAIPSWPARLVDSPDRCKIPINQSALLSPPRFDSRCKDTTIIHSADIKLSTSAC